MNLFSRSIITGFLFLGFFPPLAAQRTIPVNLERMVQRSGAIVHATVSNIETGRDLRTHLLYTSITVQVHENFFGVLGSTYTFRQFGGKADGVTYYPSRMVRYKKGQELLLMLYPPSKTGFQSPVGAEQGVFSIKTSAGGVKVASNALANRNLFHGIAQTKTLSKLAKLQQASSEGLPLSELSQAIHSLVSLYKK